ncbi:MAG: folate-binding protein [Candidatus Pacebacteria bacterium]|nr:folate-binding protein [Candidatus Paceibacterota bacterium]
MTAQVSEGLVACSPFSGVCGLPERAVLELSGADRLGFLQGLISNDVRLLGVSQPAIFAALLNAQGRFLFDFFVFDGGEDRWLIDCDGSRAEALRTSLLRYRLRSAVTLEPRRDLGVAIGMDGGFADPRCDRLGRRVIGPRESLPLFDPNLFNQYETIRITQAIPDGTKDMVVEKSLLMENNYDQYHAIAWDKGCYIGQEITARMKYRGLVKHQLRCVQSAVELPPAGAPLLTDGIEVGVMTASRIQTERGWLGLALMRVKSAPD